MAIKLLINTLKKNFDRLVLIIMILFLLVLTIKYINLLGEKSIVFEEKNLYKIAGLPPRGKGALDEGEAFRKIMEKRVNHLLSLRPAGYYQNLVNRNPFLSMRDLVVMPFALKPTTLKIGVGEKFTFRSLNGIGPYAWSCEPLNLGAFEGDVFLARTPGRGRIMAIDARGYKAAADNIEVVSSGIPLAAAPSETDFLYRGVMKINTPEGEEVLAIIEEQAAAKTHFKKVGEEIAEYVVKQIEAGRVVLWDKKNNKPVEIKRE